MKIQYQSEDVRLKVDAIQLTHQELYSRFKEYARTLVELDCVAMMELIKQESLKTNKQSRIKALNTGKYEFRIPPADRHEVLRVEFELGDDFNTILITDGFIKSHQPRAKQGKRR